MIDIINIDEEVGRTYILDGLEIIYDEQLDTYNDPVEGIEAIQSDRYKILLLDIMMPWRDHYDVFKSPRIPVDPYLTGIHILCHIRKTLGYDSDKLRVIILSGRSKEIIDKYIDDDWMYDAYFRKGSHGSLAPQVLMNLINDQRKLLK